MNITEIEFNVLKTMAEKNSDWTWMILDRVLAMRGIPGFSNVANIVTNLTNAGFVDVIEYDVSSKPRFRVSAKGLQLLSDHNRLYPS